MFNVNVNGEQKSKNKNQHLSKPIDYIAILNTFCLHRQTLDINKFFQYFIQVVT